MGLLQQIHLEFILKHGINFIEVTSDTTTCDLITSDIVTCEVVTFDAEIYETPKSNCIICQL